MAKVDSTPEDVAAMMRDVEEIVSNLRETREEMLHQGPKIVPIDVSTAVGHIAWLKRWAEKVSNAPKEARLRHDADRLRAEIAKKLKMQTTSAAKPTKSAGRGKR
ncbi:MAG TPA: hypothetical protein VF278_19360 [Pirellulales bacterium]